ncbi:MAG: amidase [SAR324 cluster bacterium]|nr:amidase [SAR324 cluster bacterium]
MNENPLHYQTIGELSRQIHSGELSPVRLTEHLLDRIEALNGGLNAFCLVMRERALAEAKAAEMAIDAGSSLGPLHGIPYALKDLCDVKGYATKAGSPLMVDNIAAEDATIVRRLARAGMILLGKTNLVQFAYGGVGINHHDGTPRNPWNGETHCVPGGSSSGSGVSVAAGMAPMAIGTDTGGSVRIPAALNGTVGLKTTVGRVSTAGVFPLSFSLDSIGPLTRSVQDAAWTYHAMHGPDPRDALTAQAARHDPMPALHAGVRGLRLAFAETVFFDGVDEEVAAAVRACGRIFEEQGARVLSIPFAEAEEAQALNPRGLVIAAEAYAFHQERMERDFDRIDPIVAHRMKAGASVTAGEYIRLIRSWEGLRGRMLESLRDVDALLVPVTMIPAAPLDEIDRSIESYSEHNLKYLRNTAIGNILNLCGLSLPCGFTAKGMPIGLMIYGKPWQEDVVLRVGQAYEQATDWHKRHPELTWAGDPE